MSDSSSCDPYGSGTATLQGQREHFFAGCDLPRSPCKASLTLPHSSTCKPVYLTTVFNGMFCNLEDYDSAFLLKDKNDGWPFLPVRGSQWIRPFAALDIHGSAPPVTIYR